MKIGLLVGREWSFPPAFIEEINRRDEGVTAEYIQLGGTRMDEPLDAIEIEVEDQVVRKRGQRMAQGLPAMAGRVVAEALVHLEQDLAQARYVLDRCAERFAGPQADMNADTVCHARQELTRRL